jgi:LAO/AO transport system kinase
MPRDGWHPAVVRTVATEKRGIDLLAETIAKFRRHFASSGERARKQTEHWRNHLLRLLEATILERVLSAAGGEATLQRLAAEVAERRKDPFAAVHEILRQSGLEL